MLDGSPVRQLSGVSLLRVDPDLAKHLRPDDIERARSALVVPAIELERGPFDPLVAVETATGCFAALLLSGLVAREVSLQRQPSLELIGPGDAVHCHELDLCLLDVEQRWSALTPTRLALLDDHFLRAVRLWPRLVTGVIERLERRHDFASLQLALNQHPRIEDRLCLLFAILADRWGRMTARGPVVDIRLTHEALGRLVGARRPTVTLALKALAAQGLVSRQADGSWLLQRRGRHPEASPRYLTDRASPMPVRRGRPDLVALSNVS